jgi:hypothetical protein
MANHDNVMAVIGLIMAAMALVTGLYASYLWWQASKIPVLPAWELSIVENAEANIMSHVTGHMIAFNKSGKKNAKAALWTAFAVAFGCVGTLLTSVYAWLSPHT